MQFRVLASAAALLGVSACGMQQPANVYAVDAGKAFSALNKSSLATQAFGNGNSQSIRMGSNKIIWRTKTYDSVDCAINLAAIEPQKTEINVNCGSGPEQSRRLVRMTANTRQQEVIEMVDATLTGRAFDRNRKGQTASRWPENKGKLKATIAGKGPPKVPESPYGDEDVPPGWYD